MLLSTLLIHFSCSKVDSAINLIKRHANRAMAVVDNNHSLSEEASLEALSSRAAAPRTILVESGRSRATASSAQVNVRCAFLDAIASLSTYPWDWVGDSFQVPFSMNPFNEEA